MPRFAIIGGGIIGTAIGLSLARNRAGDITILEKESGLGRHASGRNSGVIHSGINQKPGSLKAAMCVEGSRRLREYCRKKAVPMVECGTLVVAKNQEEITTLERMRDMGKACGVEGLILITQNELIKREPLACGAAALFSPHGATVDSLKLLESLAAEARERGVTYKFTKEVTAIQGNCLRIGKETMTADHVINCGGLHADRIAHMMGAGKQYRIIPFRGEYMEVMDCDVRTMIYQTPNLKFPFLSIHLTRETDGRVLAGPSAVLAFGREAYNKEWDWAEMAGMLTSPHLLNLIRHREFRQLAVENAKTSLLKDAFLKEIQSLVPSIRVSQIIPYRSGIRAQVVEANGRMVDDILVEYDDKSTHILNAVSPGMTCSLAFADHVVGRILHKN